MSLVFVGIAKKNCNENFENAKRKLDIEVNEARKQTKITKKHVLE